MVSQRSFGVLVLLPLVGVTALVRRFSCSSCFCRWISWVGGRLVSVLSFSSLWCVSSHGRLYQSLRRRWLVVFAGVPAWWCPGVAFWCGGVAPPVSVRCWWGVGRSCARLRSLRMVVCVLCVACGVCARCPACSAPRVAAPAGTAGVVGRALVRWRCCASSGWLGPGGLGGLVCVLCSRSRPCRGHAAWRAAPLLYYVAAVFALGTARSRPRLW